MGDPFSRVTTGNGYPPLGRPDVTGAAYFTQFYHGFHGAGKPPGVAGQGLQLLSPVQRHHQGNAASGAIQGRELQPCLAAGTAACKAARRFPGEIVATARVIEQVKAKIGLPNGIMVTL